jgi:hypothetical protein
MNLVVVEGALFCELSARFCSASAIRVNSLKLITTYRSSVAFFIMQRKFLNQPDIFRYVRVCVCGDMPFRTQIKTFTPVIKKMLLSLFWVQSRLER